MTAPLSQPPMVHIPGRDRSIYSQPNRNSHTAQHPPPSVSLGRQIYDTYDYRMTVPREYKDPEYMSDATSATCSRNGSEQDSKDNPVYSSAFSQVSRVEGGTFEDGQGGRTPYGLSYNRDGNTAETIPYSGRPTQPSENPVVYMPPSGDDEEGETDHAIWLLFWLSFLDPIYSIVGAAYACFTVIVVVLLSPLLLCDSSSSMQKWTIQFLSPILNKHLRLIYAQTDDYPRYRASILVLAYLFAPIASFGVAIAAWVAAGFWIFALIMGNPDGTERGDDGPNTVLYVRNRWAKYLTKCLR